MPAGRGDFQCAFGLVLAAPVLASLKVLGRYTTRKMLDLDPWADLEEEEKQPPTQLFSWAGRFQTRLRMVLKRS